MARGPMTIFRHITGFGLAAATFGLLATGCAKEEPGALSCVQLGIGESKVISGNTGTRLSSQYSLTRLSATAYRVTVDPQFLEAGGAQNPALHARSRERLRTCLTNARPFLKTTDGSTLEIRLTGEIAEDPVPPSIAVRVDGASQARGNAQFWTSGINDCPNMLHETMHWLGLPDEYEETQWTTECRALGPDSSIMTSPGLAYRAAGVDIEMLRVGCRCQDQACVREVRAAVGANVCPRGAVTYNERYLLSEHPEWHEGTAVPTGDGFEVNLHLLKVVGDNPAEPRSSLLYNGEFRAITQPGCSSANGLFYACSHYAYAQVRGVFQVGGQCKRSLPAECRDPQRWVQ